ncbi:MAG: hypothetical protein J1F36_01835 [Clostridiales bacterium]|nr:hypothetical protein [Clostridiales bacterium]
MENMENIKNFLNLCIWGEGPGRPYDNIYILSSLKVEKNIIHMIFEDEEECIITNPQNIDISAKFIKIENATNISWKFYYYGKPKSKETLTTIQYEKVDNNHIHITEQGAFNSEKTISVNKKIAFDSYGDINFIINNFICKMNSCKE